MNKDEEQQEIDRIMSSLADQPDEPEAPKPVDELAPVVAFARDIVEKHRASVMEKHSKPWEPFFTPATSLGYECERRILYQLVAPLKAAPIDEGLASIFEEGNLHERDVRMRLGEIGIELVESQRNFRDDVLQISGTIDGKIAVPGTGKRPRKVPAEIKSTQGNPPKTQAEWKNSTSPLMRRYYAQLQLYMFLSSEPFAIAIFKSKGTGEWTVVAVGLDYEHAEMILKRAERVRDARAAWKTATTDEAKEAALPVRQPSRVECATCPFKETLCHPEEAAVDPMLVAMDDKLLAQIDRRAELDKAASEFDAIDKELKERFKLTKGDRFTVGAKYQVTKKPHGKGIRVDFALLAGAKKATEDAE